MTKALPKPGTPIVCIRDPENPDGHWIPGKTGWFLCDVEEFNRLNPEIVYVYKVRISFNHPDEDSLGNPVAGWGLEDAEHFWSCFKLLHDDDIENDPEYEELFI